MRPTLFSRNGSNRGSGSSLRREEKTMTQSEVVIADILLAVAQRKTTVAQLKRKLADGLAYVKAIGAKNAEPGLVESLAAIESAITRIERERVKYDRVRNN